jgi:hypothetical protein
VAEPFQAAALAAPALPVARSLDGQLAALLHGRAAANLVRWSAYPGQHEVAAALFLSGLAAVEARDACDTAAFLAAAHGAASLGLPDAAAAVNQPPRITSLPLTEAVAGQPYRYQDRRLG